MRLVNLPGTDVWVNPEYVTSVHQSTPFAHGPDAGRLRVEVEYEGAGGYRTRTTNVFDVPISEVVALIQGATA